MFCVVLLQHKRECSPSGFLFENLLSGTTVLVTTPDGRQVQVQVPNGVQPGQMFQVQARPFFLTRLKEHTVGASQWIKRSGFEGI